MLLTVTAVLMLGTAPRLRVYYTVNAARVEAFRLLPDGTIKAVKLPRSLERSGTPGGPLEAKLHWIENRIQRYVDEHPETRDYQWRIRYSVDNPLLDRTRTITLKP